MKRFAFVIIGFLFIAAPIYMKYESRPVLNNGRSFTSAQLVNGQWAISLEDFAKAAGGTLTLPSNLQLQGTTLVAVSSGGDRAAKKIVQPSATSNTVGGANAKVKIDFNQGSFHIRKAGVISKNVFMANGKAWIPLSDVANAFGGTLSSQGNNTWSFTVNGDGVLAFN